MSELPAKYEKLALIGTGPVGRVFKARHIELKWVVAIKQLHEQLQLASGVRKRFLREAEDWGALNHERLLRISNVDSDRAWIIRDYTESNAAELIGQSLAHERVARILQQSLEGLQYLHKKEVLHFNLRPTNVLLDLHGHVKLSDGRGVPLHASGGLPPPSGSHKYLAPEMIDDTLGAIGPQVDLYCLGLVALELLTAGRLDALLFGKGYEHLDLESAWLRFHRTTGERYPAVRDVCPDTSPRLALVVDRLLAKPLAERFASAEAALDELTRPDAETSSRAATPPRTVAASQPPPAVLLPSSGELVPRPTTPVVLRIASGPRAGEMIGMQQDEFVVGQRHDCDVQLPEEKEPNTTRDSHHAAGHESDVRVVILRQAEGWTLRPLGDARPWLNQQLVSGVGLLRSGDIVRLSYRGPDFQFLVQDVRAIPLSSLASRFGVPLAGKSSPARPASPQSMAPRDPRLGAGLAPPAPPDASPRSPASPARPANSPSDPRLPRSGPAAPRGAPASAPPAPPAAAPAQPHSPTAGAPASEPTVPGRSLWKVKTWDKTTKNWVAGSLTVFVCAVLLYVAPTANSKRAVEAESPTSSSAQRSSESGTTKGNDAPAAGTAEPAVNERDEVAPTIPNR